MQVPVGFCQNTARVDFSRLMRFPSLKKSADNLPTVTGFGQSPKNRSTCNKHDCSRIQTQQLWWHRPLVVKKWHPTACIAPDHWTNIDSRNWYIQNKDSLFFVELQLALMFKWPCQFSNTKLLSQLRENSHTKETFGRLRRSITSTKSKCAYVNHVLSPKAMKTIHMFFLKKTLTSYRSITNKNAGLSF